MNEPSCYGTTICFDREIEIERDRKVYFVVTSDDIWEGINLGFSNESIYEEFI